jgi:cyclophilin family peptidyl-prolyl cis-trans isomerase
MSNKNLALAIVGIIIIAAAIFGLLRMGKDDKVASDESTNTQQETPQTNQTTPEQTNQDTSKMHQFVTLQVKGYGDIKIELYEQDAPKTVENFLKLTESGYYNGVTFHRIAADFVIQGGDPTGTGTGGESSFGGEFADELNPNTDSYKAGYQKGVVAMANRGPNTNTSQFFIMLSDKPLPHLYTIFGKVVSGQDIVDKLGKLQTSPPGDGAPLQKIIIEKATVSSN